jgi:phosphoribosylglycinamide formyltransferase-1
MRIAVLASGQGTNFARLIEAEASGDLGEVQIVLLGTDRACPAADFAKMRGVPVYTADVKSLGMPAWERGFLAAAAEQGVVALVLAGFMRILSSSFVERYAGHILNVHPSLLPAFPGRDAIGQALRHGVRVTGVTVHLVDETLDGGPIVLQEALEVSPGEGPDELAQRVHAVEHRLLPQAVRMLAEGRLQLHGREVSILEG